MIETDNAYVGADTAQVTPLVTGHVARVLVSDAQKVRAGQPLVILDQTDARLALAEAEAAYDQAQRRVRGYLATDRQLRRPDPMRGAETSRAAAEVDVGRVRGRARPARLHAAHGARRIRRGLGRGAELHPLGL